MGNIHFQLQNQLFKSPDVTTQAHLDQKLRNLLYYIQIELEELQKLEEKRSKYWAKYLETVRKYRFQTEEYNISNLHHVNQNIANDILEEKFQDITGQIEKRFVKLNRYYEYFIKQYESFSEIRTRSVNY